ncbi:galactose-1-phosphate uridylyltransferase [Pedococcus sp.]|jgi:UDPglucose--hexose-1-phosphate uridylyltransferase|uniref:galactose-1-phosphate uridylyltransferase n=1 Tax=Pedococcus sp. TaxID=2860345 RepID=UPI002E168016|nr:galactose-1-phosphate uridylyltransferase [Pedococcus sp.]
MSARRTSRRLADGREIIYFDDTPGAPPREASDTRPLDGRAVAGQIRYDALVGDWVAVAGHRLNRTFLPPKDECPLCPTGTGSVPSEVPETSYDVVVFENRFPSYAPVTDGLAPAAGAPELFRAAPARGRCEVVCFTSNHDATFADLTAERARTVIDAWADRTAELGAMPEVEHVFCFENRGQEIGVTLHHPHGQIYAYPTVPQRTHDLLVRAQKHHERTGRLLGADILAAERECGERIVLSSEHWTAYVPFAARWPVEVHLVPNRDVADLPQLSDAERDDLARVYLDLLRRLDRYYLGADGAPIRMPYIAGWHQAPAKRGREVSRLHLQVMSVLRAPGKLKYLAGSESGVGGWVNDVPPEAIASRLREVAP